jgi:hypothetical protein
MKFKSCCGGGYETTSYGIDGMRFLEIVLRITSFSFVNLVVLSGKPSQIKPCHNHSFKSLS